MRRLLWLVALLLWPLVAQSATYYVSSPSNSPAGSDSRNCSAATNISTPLATIGKGITCWRNPGDILYIRGGSYPEQLDQGANGINWPVGGSSFSNAPKMAGYPGETVIINPSGAAATYNIIYFDDQNASGPPNYLWFDNLTIDGANVNASVAMWLFRFGDGADLDRVGHVRLSNSKLINSHVSCSGDPPGCGYGNAVLTPGVGSEFLNNEFYGNDGYPLYITGPGNLIDGNVLHDNDAYCVHLYHGGDPYVPKVSNNIVRRNHCINNGHNNRNPAGSCGIIASSGDGGQMYNNIIANQGNPFAGGGCGIQVYYWRPPTNWKFYNNTIVGNKGECMSLEGGSGSDIRNNICYGNGAGIQGPGDTAFNDHNNPNGTNPHFVDLPNGNYRLDTTAASRSPALDAGVNLTSLGLFTDDITGTVTRPAPPTPWDQGAYEMEAGGTSGLIPEKGTFFIDDTGTNTSDCHAATGTVASPSAAPFGDYATASVCMQAGSTLYFRTGSYPPLDTSVTPFAGGSTTEATTFAAYPGETVTLQQTTGSPVVFLRNATTDHFLVFQGLILDGQNVAGTNGFAAVAGVNDIRLDGVEIRNTYFEGLFLSQTSNIGVRNGSKIHNSAVASVGVVGLDRTTNTLITGSEVYASGGPGISSYGGNSGLTIEKSAIYTTPSGKAIVLGSGDSNPKINNNLLYSGTHAVHFQTGVSGAQVFYNTGWNNSTACMLFDSGVTTSQATNNVCWASATVTNNAGSGMVLTTNQCTGPAGCTAGDPQFASTTPGNPNFLHLGPSSPARDTGTAIPSLTSDFAGKTRPDGSGVDKGAFEEVPPAPAPVNIGLVPPFRTTFFLTPY